MAATTITTHLVKSEPRELGVRCQAITGSPPEQAHSLHPAPAQPGVASSTTVLCAGHLLLHTDHFFGSRIASGLDDFVDVDAITAAFSCVLNVDISCVNKVDAVLVPRIGGSKQSNLLWSPQHQDHKMFISIQNQKWRCQQLFQGDEEQQWGNQKLFVCWFPLNFYVPSGMQHQRMCLITRLEATSILLGFDFFTEFQVCNHSMCKSHMCATGFQVTARQLLTSCMSAAATAEDRKQIHESEICKIHNRWRWWWDAVSEWEEVKST